MNEIFYFFENITSQTRVFFLVGGLFLFLTLEFGIPFFKSPYDKLNHAKINITFTLITLIINLFGAIGILKSVDLVKTYNLGLLNTVETPLWLYVLIGIALMDFIGAWFIHWIQHNVKWMWKFHIIHHSDPNVDVTSGLRHHPVENVFRLCFTILAILISGANFGLVMIYQTVSVFFAHFSHANIRLPEKIEYLYLLFLLLLDFTGYIIILCNLIQIVIMEIFFLFGTIYLKQKKTLKIQRNFDMELILIWIKRKYQV